jgi:predicted regulator of Ras-like GTPase activity (Roadblock/LC7/MglB family)
MSEFQSIVDRLERQPGVQGVMLVGVDDGMVIAGDAGPGRESDTAAALAATLFRRTRAAAGEAGLGGARFVRLEAERGQICATASDDVLIVAMTSGSVNLGRLRLEMMSAMEML